MKHRLASLAALVFVVGALAGCGKSPAILDPSVNGNLNVTAEDQAQVSAAVANNAVYVDEDAFVSADVTDIGASSGLAAIRPLRFWRTIESVDRRFDTQFLNPDSLGRPTLAIVTVRKHLSGHFNILAGPATDPVTDSTLSVVRKPLDDQWVRRLALKRVRIDSTGTHQVWRLAGVSGVDVTSKDATTNIQSLRIQAGAVDTTITNPLELYRLHRILLVSGSQAMHLTVTTGRSDDVVLLYHRLNRRPFHNNGDGTYSSDIMLGDFGGLRHVGVNALSHGTLFDDAAPYDSKAWIVGFAVRSSDCNIGDD